MDGVRVWVESEAGPGERQGLNRVREWCPESETGGVGDGSGEEERRGGGRETPGIRAKKLGPGKPSFRSSPDTKYLLLFHFK